MLLRLWLIVFSFFFCIFYVCFLFFAFSYRASTCLLINAFWCDTVTTQCHVASVFNWGSIACGFFKSVLWSLQFKTNGFFSVCFSSGCNSSIHGVLQEMEGLPENNPPTLVHSERHALLVSMLHSVTTCTIKLFTVVEMCPFDHTSTICSIKTWKLHAWTFILTFYAPIKRVL